MTTFHSDKEIRFTIYGRIPSKKNSMSILRGKLGKPFISPSSEYKAWSKSAIVSMMAHGVPRAKCLCESVEMKFYFPDNRTADLYNKAESVADTLNDYGVTLDDSWQCSGDVHLVSGGIDKDSPRVEITLKLKGD